MAMLLTNLVNDFTLKPLSNACWSGWGVLAISLALEAARQARFS
jgi:hypothetical protein